MHAFLLTLIFWLPLAFARQDVPVIGGAPLARVCSQQLLAPDTYARIFYDAYPDSGFEHGLYRYGYCGANTAQLLMRLMMGAPKPLHADAIYLRHEMRKAMPVPVYREQELLPSYKRRPDPSRDTWRFHAMVMITDEKGERFILDMDYKRDPVPLKEYFAKMFPDLDGTDRAGKIFLRVVPGVEFVAKFQQLGNGPFQNQLHDVKNTEYPLITVRALIDRGP